MVNEPTGKVSPIKETLVLNAARHGITDPRIHIARSIDSDQWQIRVVHEQFNGVPDEDRRRMILVGIENHISNAEILAPEEEGWYGPPFREIEGGLPTWPDALSQTTKAPLIFASDLDEDIDRPAIVTFYSLRGGVGRTTALAAAAQILSFREKRVLCIDMDFEAPGLPYLFRLPEPEPDRGALPLLLSLERGEEVDIRDHVQRVSEAEELYCLPAGCLSVDYAQRLQILEPEIWYREQVNPLHSLLSLAAQSTLSPDIILLDSRTGISPISAPLLFDVSDLSVVCFFPHPQAERGTELLVRSLLSAQTRRSKETQTISPEPRFLVSPVPAGPSAELVQMRAISWVDRWTADVHDRRTPDIGQLQGDELTHFVEYSADTAFSDSLRLSATTMNTYGPVADWLEQLLPQTPAIEAVQPVSKKKILHELDFSTGTAEDQESFLEDFVQTRSSVQATDRRYPLVIGRKGTGKTAIFRWLLEKPAGASPIAVMCPNAFRAKFPWTMGAEGFASIERHIDRIGVTWSTFWTCYSALVTHLVVPGAKSSVIPKEFEDNVSHLFEVDNNDLDELAIVDSIAQMLENPKAGLLGNRWLRAIDGDLADTCFLLFDGLDTGFGNDSDSRKRRTNAVSGLLSFLTETEALLDNLSFKVLLRFDIWQQLRFENKSHLFGRSVQLQWKDQSEYFKTALKQATRSPAFQKMLAEIVGEPIDSWQTDEVFQAWNLLVGERMKGGKTTFTRNWVKNRLADGLGDHSPRALSQLLNHAVHWERQEEERSKYDRSVIRPRALVPSLENVSIEALQAMHEEFPELKELISVLEAIGRTPFELTDIPPNSTEAHNQLELALEVGLLAVHEGTQEDVRRYRVPDLYRHALRMTRKGQA